MSKTITTIIIILIVIVAGFFIFFAARPGYKSPQPTVSLQVSPQTTPGEVEEYKISGTEFSFNPSTITVEPGERVRVIFKNDGAFPHNWTVEGLGIATKTINPGQTDAVEFTAPAAGTYVTFCSVGQHRANGMAGTLKVEPKE